MPSFSHLSRLGRDPFAREELLRQSVEGKCANCGGTNAKGKVYRYRRETDSGRTFEDKKLFCCNSCRDAYLG